MNRFLGLVLLGVINYSIYHFFGFEISVVTLLTLIYWAIPIDTKQ